MMDGRSIFILMKWWACTWPSGCRPTGYPQGTALWHRMCKLGAMSHREKGRVWRVLRRLMDNGLPSRKIRRGMK